MKIGINLVGVSYNDGTVGRYRNYEDALEGFMNNVVNPLKEEGHDIKFYLYSYDSIKQNNILEAYQPVQKYNFDHPAFNGFGGGDKVPNGYKAMSAVYMSSLLQLLNEDLDLVISTRFDINFFKNPFKEYPYDFNKFNFLWREPVLHNLPLVNDTFVVFPYSMLMDVIKSIDEMELNPHQKINIAMHNWYQPLVKLMGEDKVQWVCDDFVNAISNTLYKLMRHE